LHERAHAVEPVLGVDAADRADVAGDEGRGLVARPPVTTTFGARAANAPSRFEAQPVT
jgi:hypothetical protein